MSDIIHIPNIEKYTLEIINGELILTPKKKIITETELYQTDFLKSKLIKCIIRKDKEIISSKKEYYATILKDIWKYMPTQKILQTTTYNFKLTNEKRKNGYTWFEDIKMSYQGKDSNGIIKEIINMCNVNGFQIDLTIELETGRIINFKKNY
tara:strand:+ start:230 stop:685 length:456 start_codon:yes stop_codon:yes gene_type:complete